MWTRAELKERAKALLNKNYWMVVVVTLIITVTSGGMGSVGGSLNSRLNSNTTEQQSSINQWDNSEFGTTYNSYEEVKSQVSNLFGTGIILFVILIILIVLVVAIAMSIFLFNPLRVGCYKWYIFNRKENPQIGMIGDAFKDNYMGTVEIMFCRDLFIFLWSLLFVIPGIIKAYEYRMVPYIVAENPNISRSEAFEMSKSMMTGEKWNAFVLDISFILWYMASGICCGIVGIFYVFPYVQLTNTELYITLKELHLGIPDDAYKTQNNSNGSFDDGYNEI